MTVSADAVGQASLCAPMPLANILWPHTDLIHHLTGMTERLKLVRGGLLISLSYFSQGVCSSVCSSFVKLPLDK